MACFRKEINSITTTSRATCHTTSTNPKLYKCWSLAKSFKEHMNDDAKLEQIVFMLANIFFAAGKTRESLAACGIIEVRCFNRRRKAHRFELTVEMLLVKAQKSSSRNLECNGWRTLSYALRKLKHCLIIARH